MNKNILNTFLTSSVKIGINLLLFFVLSKKLSPINYGLVSTYDSTLQYFLVIGTIGIPVYSVQLLSKSIFEDDSRKNIVKSFFTIIFISSLFLILFSILILTITKFELKTSVIAILFINIFVNNLQCDWYFEGTQRFDIIRNRVIFFKLFFLFIILVTINNENALLTYSGLFALSQLLLFFFTIKIIMRNENFKFKDLISLSHLNSFLKKHLKNLLSTYTIQILISIYLLCDIFILKYNSNMEEVGYYSMALRIAKMPMFIFTSISVAMNPALAQKFKLSELEYNKQIDLIVVFNILMSFVIFTFIACFSKELILVFSSNKYIKSSQILTFLSLILLFIPISNILGNVNSIISSDFKYLLRTFLFIAIISVFTNYFFSIHYKSFGTSISTVISEFLVFISLFYRNRRRIYFSKKIFYIIAFFSIIDLIYIKHFFNNTNTFYFIIFIEYLVLFLLIKKLRLFTQLLIIFSK